MKLAAGVAPVSRLLKAGVAVGLGTDGAASNNVLNLWEEIDTAAKLHKLVAKDPRVLNAHEALELATIGGARAIHRDKEIGSLEVGKLADLIVVRMDGAHQTPVYDVVLATRVCHQVLGCGNGGRQWQAGDGQEEGADSG